MAIEYLKYKLEVTQALNHLGYNTREGILLRQDSALYADYHPWVEWGDEEITAVIEEIKSSGRVPAFIQQQFDLFRQREEIKPAPFKNHFFGLEEKPDKGSIVKLKWNHLKQIDTKVLKKYKLRLDLNNKFTEVEFNQWSKSLEGLEIDFIEDPYPNAKEKSSPFPIAYDFNVAENMGIKIYKPCREIRPKVQRIIYSHSQGHILGRYIGYLDYCLYGDKDEVHGLHSPVFYRNEETLFSQGATGEFTLNEQTLNKVLINLKQVTWSHLI